MLQTDGGNFGDFEELTGMYAAMARHDLQMGINENGDVEPKSFDAVGKLTDLFVAVESRVLRVEPERTHGKLSTAKLREVIGSPW